MTQDETEYQRKTRSLCTHLDSIIYKILLEDPLAEWDLSEIQDRIELGWGIRPYCATLLRHAANFYNSHHIPLFYKASFTGDKYKLNNSISTEEWQDFFKPKPKGRPRKRNVIDEF
jgi:hypothetical protein